MRGGVPVLSRASVKPKDSRQELRSRAGRHFGLVVDDPAKGRALLDAMGIELMSGPGVNFNDPWGNYVQLVTYEKIQFDKTPGVLRAMGLDDLEKTEKAKQEIADKGFAD